jgi:hypothetical protein
MPFFLLFIAVIFIVAGYRGTHKQLFTLIKGDFYGWNSFIPWVVSILAVGAVGYIPKMKEVSDGFLFLILLVLVISRKGFFNQLMSQLKKAPPQDASGTNVTNTASGSVQAVAGGFPTIPSFALPSGVSDSSGANLSTSVSGSAQGSM